MDIFTLYEAYKFIKKHTSQEGVIHWEVLDETVLHVDSHAWPAEMVEKYKTSMEEVMNQLRKEKERIYKGNGREKYIIEAIAWGIHESSFTDEEKLKPVKSLLKPLNRVNELLNGFGEFDGKLLSDEEISLANQSIAEIVKKYKQACRQARGKSIKSFFYMIITLLIVYIYLTIA